MAGAPEELAQLLPRLLASDPADRPSVTELFRMPALASRAAAMPNPVLLDGSEELPAAPRDDPTGTDAHWQSASRAASDAGTSGGSPTPTQLLQPCAPCWAKHACDGLWHLAVVHAVVDADSYLVEFTERQAVDVAWFDCIA